MHNTARDNNELICEVPEGTRIVLAGLGGIGGALLQPLMVMLNSLDIPLRVIYVDGDTYQPRDGERQIFSGIGNKAEVKAAETLNMLDTTSLTVVAVPQHLEQENIAGIIRAGDMVFLCVDNHETRRLVSDHCQTLADVVLISGGNDGVDPPHEMGTYGNVQVFIRRNGRNATASLSQFHPEIANATGKPPQLGCGQLAVSQRQIIATNFAVASAMLNAFFAYTSNRLHYQEVKLDILAARMLPQLPVAPEQACPAG